MNVVFSRWSVVKSPLQVTASIFMSACLSFHIENLDFFWINFCENVYWSF